MEHYCKAKLLNVNFAGSIISDISNIAKLFHHKKKSNLHCSRCVSPKRVKSWWCPSPRHCAWATQLLSKKCRSDGDSLATLRPFWSATDSNSRPLARKRTPVTALNMNPRQKHHNFDSPINWPVLFPLSNVERENLSKKILYIFQYTNRFSLSPSTFIPHLAALHRPHNEDPITSKVAKNIECSNKINNFPHLTNLKAKSAECSATLCLVFG